MVNNFKKRLAVFLSILMVLPGILSVLPMTAQEVQAGNVYMSWEFSSGQIYSNDKPTISVEAGQKFYIGDYVYVSDDTNYETGSASMVKASYRSSKPSIASVNSKGYVTTKKTGKSTITVKFKGETIKCVLKVVKKGSFGNKQAAKALRKEVSKLEAKIPSKLTGKNGFALKAQRKAYSSVVESWEDTTISGAITYDGFLKRETGKLIVPQAGRFHTADRMLWNFANKNNPTSTRSAKVFQIASASASAATSQIKVTFKKAVTADQILALQIYESSTNEKNGKSTGSAYVSIYDVKGKKWVYGIMDVKKGSKTGVIKNIEFYDVNAGGGMRKLKLKKGCTYELGESDSWSKGKK